LPHYLSIPTHLLEAVSPNQVEEASAEEVPAGQVGHVSGLLPVAPREVVEMVEVEAWLLGVEA
jgi:hypothetical protein